MGRPDAVGQGRRRRRLMIVACARCAQALRPLVRRGMYRAGASPAETEDVVQDILIAVHLKRHTWDDTRPIGPWIAGIARYKIIDSAAPARVADRIADRGFCRDHPGRSRTRRPQANAMSRARWKPCRKGSAMSCVRSPSTAYRSPTRRRN